MRASTPAPATTSRATFPDLVDALDFEGAIDGELLVGARRRGRLRARLVRRPAAAAEPQDRDRRSRWRATPPSSAPTTAWSTAARTSAPCPSRERRARLEALVARSRSTRHRPVAAPRLRRRRRARGAARRAARAGDRGRDAEALGLGLRARPAEGAVVQVEARPAHRRRGADVRPARPRQALVLLFRLHLRRLARRRGGRRAGPGRQGLFRLHRRGTRRDRPLRAQQHRRAASARCARSCRAGEGPGARGRLRGPAALDPPQVRRRHALSRASRASAGTSRRRRPTGWRRWRS